MNKILVVEDDLTIREGIKDFLQSHNFIVEAAEDGAEAISKVKNSQPDLVILDLGLPKITGESVCREIKRDFPQVYVIMLTAKNASQDVVGGFKSGADDYISKPFELEELLARIQARLKTDAEEKLQVADLIVDSSSVTVVRGGKKIKLSPHEFKLLHYLMLNKGKVLSREMILNRVWQYSYDVDSRVVDVYMGYLRKKIDGENSKKLLASVRGFGYSIND
jgi:DNA-binding response OmpR family regulator